MDKEEMMKTGTTTLGIIFKEGIILAADKRATAGNFIAGKHFDKIHTIDDSMAVTIAGMVSDAQLLVKVIRAEIKLRKVRTNVEVTVKETTNLVAGMCYSNLRKMSMVPGIVGFLVAGKDSDGYHIYSIDPSGGITEERGFASDGSGSVFALVVLETLWKKDLNQDEAVKLALKSLNAAMQRDSASGSGFDIVTITKDGVKKIMTQEINLVVQ